MPTIAEKWIQEVIEKNQLEIIEKMIPLKNISRPPPRIVSPKIKKPYRHSTDTANNNQLKQSVQYTFSDSNFS